MIKQFKKVFRSVDRFKFDTKIIKRSSSDWIVSRMNRVDPV